MFSPAVKTIRLEAPSASATERNSRSSEQSTLTSKLVSFERVLRRKAYRNALIKTEESFYDDSDMKSAYYLVVVYDCELGLPLLSARYYYDRSVISHYLGVAEVAKYPEGEFFLIDRLSGNTCTKIYREHRDHIHRLMYSEVLERNKGKKIFLMARKERQEKLLRKYLELGFEVVGIKNHLGKEHWILSGNL